MDSALYKDLDVSRGFNYHYYYSPAQPGKPTLLFCHGFPSTSQLWIHIAPSFKDKGYGVLVPDLLGYSGTDRPTNPALYTADLLTKDIADILDAEKLDRVIAVGHDWGSFLVSRMANYFPERVSAYAFLALSYFDPWPDMDFDQFLKSTVQLAGYELFGYWPFFSEDDADATIQAHLDSFIDILYPGDPKIWIDRFALTGSLKRSLLEDFRAPAGAYLTEQARAEFVELFRKNGFVAPTCWYKVHTGGFSRPIETQIPEERKFPSPSSPIFFGAAKHDYVCLPQLGVAGFQRPQFKEHKITIKEYDADHWLILSVPQDITRDLEAWVEGL